MLKTIKTPNQKEMIKQEIDEIIKSNFSSKILDSIGSLIESVLPKSKPVPWYVSAFFLEVVVIVPQSIVGLVMKDINQVIGIGLFWSLAALLVMLIVPIIHLSSKYIMTIIRNYIVDAIKNQSDLHNLLKFLLEIKNSQKIIVLSIITSLIWSVFAIPYFSFLNNGFIGLSYSFDVWIFGFFGCGVGAYYLLWLMRFPNQLRNYQYKLYQLDPSRSEVIVHISNIFTRPFLTTAIYLAIVTITASFFQIFNWTVFVMIVAFWVPLIFQFFNSQSAIKHIISSEKWRALNEIQVQIHEHKKGIKLKSPEEIEKLNKLMDLYERVYNSKNIKLTLSSIFDLLNQLFLPLLAFIISNYDKVLNFFKP